MKAPLLTLLLGVAALFSPFEVSAHAMPVAYEPQSGAVTSTAPEFVSVTFSERIDVRASTLKVTGPSGTLLTDTKPQVLEDDPRTIVVPVRKDEQGTYVVSWSVVSSDDGHFTKGAFAFGVGEGTQVAQTSATSEVVKVAGAPEAIAMTVELAGNGIIWAALVLYAFVVRRLLLVHTGAVRTVQKGYAGMIYAGAGLAVLGGLLQLVIKAGDLASLQDLSLMSAFGAYVYTAAGSATVARMGIVFLVALVFFFARTRIVHASRVTVWEWLLGAGMLGFAYFRAVISHATANEFHPEFSVFVNVVHLVEKDIWFGFLLALVLTALAPRLRDFLNDLLPKVFVLLAINLALVSVTACYIVWLHLKSFSNLFTTEWGSAFLLLLLAATLMVGARTYHTLARLHVPKFFARLLPATLAIELIFALLVIYASSAIIITSPPLPIAEGTRFTKHDQGAVITLVREGGEDSVMHLYIEGATNSPEPFVTVSDTESTAPGFQVPLRKRFDGAYSFPALLVGGTGPYEISIIAPQRDGYDANATFTLTKEDVALSKDPGKERTFDAFAMIIAGVGCAALLFALLLRKLSTVPAPALRLVPVSVPPYLLMLPASLLAAVVATGLGALLLSSGLLNPFKAACIADGNMWHSMLPTRAGIPISQVPMEGCMWGMGDYPYLITDAREYAYVSSLGKVEATLVPNQVLVTNVPITFTAKPRNDAGDPALLFVDMEKLLHMVVVSEDQSEYAHIHPDDLRPLTEENIRSSTFTFVHTFPKAGRYLVSLDYAHGVTLGSTQFVFEVAGGPSQAEKTVAYPSRARFGEYDVSLSYGIPTPGTVTTLIYDFTKDGKPATDLTPYLSAAMHVAVVKNDFSSFVHTHGEIHPPGVPYPPVLVKNGKIVHTMASMVTPPTFGPRVEAHVIFPTKGRYTVWGQFKAGGKVIPTSFTVDVE